MPDAPKPRHGSGPYARACHCPRPRGRLWCYLCGGTVKLTAGEAARLVRQPTTPPAGGGEARPVAVA